MIKVCWISNSNNLPDLSAMFGYNTVITYFISKAMEKLGVDFCFVQDTTDGIEAMESCDFAIIVSACAYNVFSENPAVFDRVSNKTRYGVCKLTDGPNRGLYITDNSGKYIPPLYYAGFGCSEEFLFPEQEKHKQITILLNLWNKSIQNKEFTDEDACAIRAVEEIAKDNKNIEVIATNHRTEIIKNVVDIVNEKRFDIARSSYVPWLDIIKIYRKTSILVDTTGSAIGLNAIESAACGSKLVVPPSAIETQRKGKSWNDFSNCDYVMWENPDDIYSLLQNVIDSDIPYRENHKQVVENMNWDIFAARLFAALQQLSTGA